MTTAAQAARCEDAHGRTVARRAGGRGPAAPQHRVPRSPLLRARRSGDHGCRVRRAVPPPAGAGGRAPRAGHARLAHPAGRGHPAERLRNGSAHASRCCRCRTSPPRRRWRSSTRGSASCSATSTSSTSSSRSSTAWRWSWSTRTARWRSGRRAATASSGENVTANLRTDAQRAADAPRRTRAASRSVSRCAARSICRSPPSGRSTATARRRASRCSPIPRNSAAGLAEAARRARSRPAARSTSSATASARSRASGVADPRGAARRLRRLGPAARRRASRRATDARRSGAHVRRSSRRRATTCRSRSTALVVKVNDARAAASASARCRARRAGRSRGSSSRARPTTTILRIFPSVGRTGVLTPAAELEPVAVGGVTVRNASLHNMDEVERKDVRDRRHRPDRARRRRDPVRRAGAARATHRREQPFEMPAHCPVCGAQVVRPEDEVAYRCIGAACPAQLKQSLRFFASRGGDGHRGARREARRAARRPAGWCSDLADLYPLDEATLVGLERMGEKSAAEPAGADRAQQADHAAPPAGRARHPAGRRGDRQGAGRALRHARRA